MVLFADVTIYFSFNRFKFDDSIVTAIEDHCSIKVPPISFYSLVRTDELPKNYIVSPVKKSDTSKSFNFIVYRDFK